MSDSDRERRPASGTRDDGIAIAAPLSPKARVRAAQQAAGMAAVARITGAAPAAAAADKPVDLGPPAAGMGGTVTADLAVTFEQEGKQTKGTLAAGSAVSVVSASDGVLRVQAFSGHDGAYCDLPADHFRAEPEVAHRIGADTGKRMDDVSFAAVSGPLWNGAPKATDVNQGYLGDCYLIASMGAVAAANPAAIQALFSPQTPNQKSYAISLWGKQADASGATKYVKRTFTVDASIPVYTGGTTPHYAGQLDGDVSTNGAQPGVEAKPLWPILLEKAYAILRGREAGAPSGDYGAVGDSGGLPEEAMAALTGTAASPGYVPDADADVLAQFAGYVKDHRAVVCSTIGSQDEASIGGFAGAGRGPYTLAVQHNGEDAELVGGTVHVTDAGGKVAEVTDDGTQLQGADLDAKGSSIVYSPASLSIAFVDGKAPAKPADLHLAASVRGLLDKTVRLHAWHSYIFESYDPKTKLLQFRNPWGTDHPKPITAAQFRQYFESLASTTVPAPGRG